MTDEVNRTHEYSRNPELESLLERLGNLLEKAEGIALLGFVRPAWPVILVHGCARSGTTLIMQLLAATGVFAYPSNLISRFYKSPYIGALIQLMLTDPKYNYRNEFSELANASICFESSLGKTSGILSPNEFNYFWRRFFNHNETQYLNKDQLGQIDYSTLLAELAGFERVFNKPVLVKGMLMNWNIEYLNNILVNPIFVHVQRDVLFNAQSLLEARMAFYGDKNQWYSFKPPEYYHLQAADPLTQVVGQVIYTNRAITDGLASVPDERKLTVQYENLCNDPGQVISALLSLLENQGYPVPEYNSAVMRKHVINRDRIRLMPEQWAELERIHATFDDKHDYSGRGSDYD